MKNECARVVTLYSYNLDTQGRLTLLFVVRCGQKSNSSKLLWLSLLPARMKKIHQKMKALQWAQHFSNYKSMRTFPDAQGQLTL